MTDVTPLPKTPRLNKRGHEYRCKCKQCTGARSRREGLKKQRNHLKALARVTGTQQRYRTQLSNEEHAGLIGWQAEIKSGAQIPKLLLRAFHQAEAATAVGSGRKPMVVLQPDGVGSRGALAVLKMSDFLDLLSALQATETAVEGPTGS